MKQKIYKLLSVVLTLSLVFTCCMVAFNATAEETKAPITYYVSPEGVDAEGRGLTPETPLASVNSAILAAQELNYGAGDTVNVKVINVEGKVAYLNSETANTLDSYDFTLCISSNDNASLASIGVQNKGFSLTGDLRVENIKLNLGQSNWGAFAIGNNDFYIGKNVTMLGSNNYDFVLGQKENDPFTEDMTVYFGSRIKNIAQGAYSRPLYTNVSTFIYDNNASNTFNFATSQPRTTIYNGTLNFIINDVRSFSLSTFSSKGGTYSFGVGKAVQLVNNGKGDISSAIACLDEMQDKEGNPIPYYVYKNTTSVANAMETTKTVGKIKVNLDPSAYEYIALVNADGSVEAKLDENGYITVPTSGEYTLKVRRTATYYVSPTGDDSAIGDLENPLKSINGAVVAAKAAGYGADDTVRVKLIKAYEEGTSTEIQNLWFTDENRPAWTTNNSNPLTKHDFKLDISSYTDKVTIDNVDRVSFTGETALSNITLGFTKNYAVFNLGGQDVTVASDVGVNEAAYASWVLADSSGAKRENINVYLGSMNNTFRVGGNYASPTFKNINITFDANAGKTVAFGGQDKDRVTTFNGLLNLNVKNMTSLAFGDAKGTLVFNTGFAAQVINSTGKAAVSTNAITYFSAKTINGTEDTVPYYVINNSYAKDAIEFTDTAGKFKLNVDTSFYNVELVKTDDATVKGVYADGYVTVTQSGQYNLVLTKKSGLKVTYYVSPNGDDANSGRTVNDPVATIGGAITAAKNAGYNAGDTVYAKLIKTFDADNTTEIKHSWGTLPTHDFVLNISSYADKAHIDMNLSLSFNGDMEFENVQLDWVNGQWKNFNFRGHNVSMLSTVSINAGHCADSYLVWSVSNMPNELNYYFETLPSTMILGGYDSSATLKNVNITLAKNFSRTFSLGDKSRGTTTYDGMLNFNLKDSANVSFGTAKGTLAFTENFALQLINSTGKTTASDNAVAYFSDKKITGTDTTVPYYVINNNTGKDDIISTTATAGTFAINGLADDKKLCIYNKETGEIFSASGTFTLTKSGQYEVWVENDVNSDLATDIRDLVYASENINAEDANIIKRADIDGNGKVEKADVELLRKILLGIIV